MHPGVCCGDDLKRRGRIRGQSNLVALERVAAEANVRHWRCLAHTSHRNCQGDVGGIYFILGSIPNAAGTMVLCSFAFLTAPLPRVADDSPEMVSLNPICDLVWVECGSRKR